MANPTLNDRVFTNATPDYRSTADAVTPAAVMTIEGSVGKTLVLLGIMLTTAGISISMAAAGTISAPLLYGALILGFIVGLVTSFNPRWAPFTAPVYAALEGVVVGLISFVYGKLYNGIAIQAVALTVGVLFMMLMLYATKVIQPTQRLKSGVIAATGAIALVYLVSMGLRLFHIQMPFLHDSGPLGIGISLVITAVAAFNLILDFDFIEQGAARRAPKYLEWYAGFGLLVTLVWLYLEVLRLLAKLNRR